MLSGINIWLCLKYTTLLIIQVIHLSFFSLSVSDTSPRDEDPDPLIFGLPDPILFSSDPVPDHTG